MTPKRGRNQGTKSHAQNLVPDGGLTPQQEQRLEGDFKEAQEVITAFCAAEASRALVPATGVRLSAAAAEATRQDVEGVIESIERAQARLRGLLRSLAAAVHPPAKARQQSDEDGSSHNALHDEDACNEGAANAHARSATYLEDTVAGQAKRARAAAGLAEQPANGDGAGSQAAHLFPETRAVIQHSVDSLMRTSEGALLMSRTLLTHAADVLAVVHALPVPVHPSQQAKVGAKSVTPKQLPQIATEGSMRDAVAAAIDDIRGFSVEKHGVAPDVTLVDACGEARAQFMPAFVDYAIAEVLKNAVQAMVEQHGAWDLDEAPPIEVRVSVDDARAAADAAPSRAGRAPELWTPASNANEYAPDAQTSESEEEGPADGESGGGWWHIEVRDRGPGMSEEACRACRSFFHTTTPPHEASYGYSKAHGAQYSGLGVGMPLTALYVEFMGGRVDWRPLHGGGVAVTVALPRNGFAFLPAERRDPVAGPV